MADETPAARLKRMQLRSMRRGIKEMDLILGQFAREKLAGLSEAELAVYDELLEENDHDILAWVIGHSAVPERFSHLITNISGYRAQS